MSAFSEALTAATTDADTLAALARGTGGDGAEVPTPEALAEWWSGCPARAEAEAAARLQALARIAEPDAPDGLIGGCTFTAWRGWDGTDPAQLWARWPVAMRTAWTATESGARRLRRGEDGPPGVEWIRGSLAGPLAVSRRWIEADPDTRPAHPLAPIVKAWQKRRVEIEANKRDDPLFPGLILPRRTWEGRNGEAEVLFALRRRSAAAKGFLPDMAPGEVDGEAPPATSLPLELWDLSAGKAAGGRHGAPLAGRVFVDTVLDVGVERWDVSAARGVTLPPERFPDFLQRLFPDTWQSWDRRRFGALLEALERVNSARIGYDMIGPDGKPGGAGRKVVSVVDEPRTGKRDDWVRFAVHLPPTVKTADAVLLDRPALRRAGTKTAAAWRLVLSLSADWNRPGKARRPVGRGRHWLQRHGWDAYDPRTDAQLVAMAFPRGGEVLSRLAFRKRLQRARNALGYLAGCGFCEVKRDGKGWRIRPGPKWAGWSNP